MPPKPKSLTEEEIKQIRGSLNYQEIAKSLGISKKRAKAIKDASTLEKAMKIAAPEDEKSKPKKATKKEEGKVTEVLTEASIKPEASKTAEPPVQVVPPTPLPAATPPLPPAAPPSATSEVVPEVQERPYRALIPEEIVGKGIPFKITLSVGTIAYYQIASSIDHNLGLGDFLDHCVQDTFEGRGLTLGLIKSG